MAQFDINYVLNDLKKLSDETDIAIHEPLKEEDEIDKWFDIIKENVNEIVKGTYIKSKTSKTSLDKTAIPSIIEFVKCKQPKNQARVSVLLVQNQKDHIQHTNRKSRNSLRRIVLQKKSSNNWEITRSGSKDRNPLLNNSTPPNSDKNTDSEFKTSLVTSGTSIDKSQNVANDILTPLNNELEGTNCAVTPLTRSKKLLQDAEQHVKSQNKKVKLNGTYEKTPINSNIKCEEAVTQIIKKTKKFENCNDVSTPVTTSTPLNKTMVLDSNDSKQNFKAYETPQKHLKRKSTFQLTQENTKKIKSKTCEKVSKYEITVEYNSAKNPKTTSNITLQAKTSGILSQYNSTQSEKRVLREIQKEDRVSQNAKKIKSLRQLKIEENKKNREIKMEKAMQQRLKLEKEKERLRCRTHSKQEVALQKEVTAKKPLKKVQLQEEKVSTPKKNTAESLQSNKEHKSNKKAPPKPVRTPAKTTHTKQVDSGYASNGEKMTDITNKPVKSLLTSYAMTPHQSSFVSYDISEIKSDDSDEEEENNQKPIPSWASSVRLRTAVLTQYYNPFDTDELFGNCFETPDLASIMGIQSKKYYKRTSSAVWARSPNCSILS